MALLQPAEHSLDDVALPVFGAVEQPWQAGLGLAFHGSQRNHRLHPVTVAVLAQVLGIVAFICQQPAAALARPAWLARDANLIQECQGIRDVAGLARRQQKAQRHTVGVAGQWILVVRPPRLRPNAWSTGSSGPPFFPAPEKARVARTAVGSIIQVSRSISPS